MSAWNKPKDWSKASEPSSTPAAQPVRQQAPKRSNGGARGNRASNVAAGVRQNKGRAAAPKKGSNNGANKGANKSQDKGKRAAKERQTSADRNKLYRGLVKEVTSGDTIKVWVIDSSVSGTPEEKELTLVGLRAPYLTRLFGRSNDQKEAKFAFAAREFLRKKLIGQTVTFRIEHSLGKGLRNYSEVWLGTKFDKDKDIRSAVVAAGFATVNEGKGKRGSKDEYLYDYVNALQTKAKEAKVGQFSADASSGAPRKIKEITDSNRLDFFNKYKKKPLDGVIEQIRSGSTFRVFVPNLTDRGEAVVFQVLLAGIKTPMYKYNAKEPEPFAREAKFYAERQGLHRDATLILEGIDKFDSFFGTVLVDGKNIAIELLQVGLAEVVSWSAPSDQLESLKKAENVAREAKTHLWDPAHVARAGKTQKRGSKLNFKARVVEIVNAGTIRILRNTNKNQLDMKLSLSSISVPRLVRRTDIDQMKIEGTKEERLEKTNEKREAIVAWQAREYLRDTLIGKTVECHADYLRPKLRDGVPEKQFWSVHLPGKETDLNVALELVRRGFAKVVDARGEHRNDAYGKLLEAEALAKKTNRGLHSKKPPTNIRVNDLSQQNKETRNKCKVQVEFLKRSGDMRAIVEYVFSASRVKLWIPRESIMLSFSLIGINTEKPKRTSPQGKPAYYNRNESLGNYALHWARDKILQHYVTIRVESIDKYGTFFGTLKMGDRDFGEMILEEGLGKVFYSSLEGHRFETIYSDTQTRAQDQQKNVWQGYDREKVRAERAAKRRERDESTPGAKMAAKQEVHKIYLTHVVDGHTFWFQTVSDELKQLEELMAEFGQTDFASMPEFVPSAGDICVAKFDADGQWYRAKCLKVLRPKIEKPEEGQEPAAPEPIKYHLLFVDYGNEQIALPSKIRAINASSHGPSVLPSQALFAKLAYIQCPTEEEHEDDNARDAVDFLKSFAWGRETVAKVQFRQGDCLHVLLGDTDGQYFLNAEMVKHGLALVPSDKRKIGGPRKWPKEMVNQVKELRKEQEAAKEDRIGIWQYGDAGYDDDEDDRRR